YQNILRSAFGTPSLADKENDATHIDIVTDDGLNCFNVAVILQDRVSERIRFASTEYLPPIILPTLAIDSTAIILCLNNDDCVADFYKVIYLRHSIWGRKDDIMEGFQMHGFDGFLDQQFAVLA